MTDATDREPRYRVPHLDLAGEPIEWLNDFPGLVNLGVVPREMTDDDTANNIYRAHRGFRALKFHVELYGGWGNSAATQIADLLTDLLTDLHHLMDAFGVTLEEVVKHQNAIYNDEVIEGA